MSERFGPYELVQCLGRGGMAEAWKATREGPGGFHRTLVVKKILEEHAGDELFVQMFLREARLSALLHHPNIVQVYELGEEAGTHYLAMELIDGKHLAAVIRAQLERGHLSIGLAVQTVYDVCRALEAAHQLSDEDGKPLGLIHRDVSPSNVMLAFEGTVKLLDFGIAKALQETSDYRTKTGVLKGKLWYLAPESVRGEPIDHRADLFAAGIVLHEALTGRRLFRSKSDAETLALIRRAEVVPPSEWNPEVPPVLDQICLKALAGDRDLRYQSGGEMAAALKPVLHELRFGPEQLRRELAALFSGQAQPEVTVALPPATRTVVRAEQPRRRWWIGAVAVVAATVTWFASRPSPPAAVMAPADLAQPADLALPDLALPDLALPPDLARRPEVIITPHKIVAPPSAPKKPLTRKIAPPKAPKAHDLKNVVDPFKQ